jgi:hypothetical protein
MLAFSAAMLRPNGQTKAAMVNAAVVNQMLFCGFIGIRMIAFEI